MSELREASGEAAGKTKLERPPVVTLRTLAPLLVAGALFIIAGFMWREQLLTYLEQRSASVPATAPSWAPPGELRPATPQEKEAAVASIQAQLDAFHSDDFGKAATYQSTGLRTNFPSLDAFRTMMKSRYPDFINYRAVEFGDAQANASGDTVTVPVTLKALDGIALHAVYTMVREEGQYRVSGVEGGRRAAPAPEEVL